MKVIDTEMKLKLFLKIFKKNALKQGMNEFELYPNFAIYYDKDISRFQLPKEVVLETALDVLLGD